MPVPAAMQSSNAPVYTFTTLAGYAGQGSADGVGNLAQFNSPEAVAVDANNNIYVADTLNDTVRMITPAGVVSTIAGFAGTAGADDGQGAAARFSSPMGVAADNAGNLYVADSANDTIRELTPAGTNWLVTTIAGAAGSPGSTNGLNGASRFYSPRGLAVDSGGNLYVADYGNYTIRKITPVGTNWSVITIAGSPGVSGSADGTNSNALFSGPAGVAVDTNGNVYVVDVNNNNIRKITRAGINWVTSTIATTTRPSMEAFNIPCGLAVDGLGNVFVPNTYGMTIMEISPVGASWVVNTLAGSSGVAGSADGTGSGARFNYPSGVALDGSGNVYVSDTYNSAIRKITPVGVVHTLAGALGSLDSVDDVGNNARFSLPTGVAVDGADNVYVADIYGSTIRQVTSAGEVSTIAGSAGSYGSTDGDGDLALFRFPARVAVDSSENLYVADNENFTIRKITPAGVVSTIAGLPGSSGTNDGQGGSARFSGPCGIAVDKSGIVYVTDSLNKITVYQGHMLLLSENPTGTGNCTIRKLTPSGTNWMVSTIAGDPKVSGWADGTGTNALFADPEGIAVDASSNLFVVDTGNDIVRKITPSGNTWQVSTIAGRVEGFGHVDGVGTNAMFGDPGGIAVDSAGNLYIADTANNTIRKISQTGTNWIVSTIGGLAGVAGSSDGAGSAALFDSPYDVAVDKFGTLFVADIYNNTIRKGTFTGYTPANAVAFSNPPQTGQLMVTLLPAGANGQWRFPWEVTWHDSGYTATNLAAGNYPVEFRSLPGWLAIPPNLTTTNPAVVLSTGLSQITNYYYPTETSSDTTGGAGSLTVYLGANPPSGAGWRFLGDNTPFLPSNFTTNLQPGTYLIEFAWPFSGRATPPNVSIQIFAGLPTYIPVTYPFAAAPPSGVLLPSPVPASEISDVADYPFGFNGQLETDVGYGSGVVVQSNVVLTAAHLVFNDATVSYVSGAYWFLQQEVPSYAPSPLAARGWYVLSGYAMERTNDLESGLAGPDQSTHRNLARNLDVAALYFLTPAAGGSYGGYLPSDAVPNQWLTSTAEKMLVGYPVDGSLYGLTDITNGVMYEIGPQPYSLALDPESVTNQQEVYSGAVVFGLSRR